MVTAKAEIWVIFTLNTAITPAAGNGLVCLVPRQYYTAERKEVNSWQTFCTWLSQICVKYTNVPI